MTHAMNDSHTQTDARNGVVSGDLLAALEVYRNELDWQLTEAETHRQMLRAFYVQMEISKIDRKIAQLSSANHRG